MPAILIMWEKPEQEGTQTAADNFGLSRFFSKEQRTSDLQGDDRTKETSFTFPGEANCGKLNTWKGTNGVCLQDSFDVSLD